MSSFRLASDVAVLNCENTPNYRNRKGNNSEVNGSKNKNISSQSRLPLKNQDLAAGASAKPRRALGDVSNKLKATPPLPPPPLFTFQNVKSSKTDGINKEIESKLSALKSPPGKITEKPEPGPQLENNDGDEEYDEIETMPETIPPTDLYPDIWPKAERHAFRDEMLRFYYSWNYFGLDEFQPEKHHNADLLSPMETEPVPSISLITENWLPEIESAPLAYIPLDDDDFIEDYADH